MLFAISRAAFLMKSRMGMVDSNHSERAPVLTVNSHLHRSCPETRTESDATPLLA